jgi:hypothetical protein
MTFEQMPQCMPRRLQSRFRLLSYRALGVRIVIRNWMEGGERCRRLCQIEIGDFLPSEQRAS